MKSVSVRDLQRQLRHVIQSVEQGETIEITRRRRPVARLSPIRAARRPDPWPDLDRRAREVLGERVLDGVLEGFLADRGSW